MKASLLSVAILGGGLTIASADTLPRINVESLCRARSADDRMMKLPESQPVADCIQDEKTSRDKLGTAWPAAPGSLRARCRADAVALGTLSYLDLLTCLQMADDIKAPSSDAKAARKPRNR
jgi:hypothetical protein